MLEALRFLTIIPVGGAGRAPRASALAAFPVVGVVVGLFWAVPVAWLERAPVPTAVTASVVLIIDAVVTGGMHLDAAADVVDGLASRRRGDEAVTVMRDPAVGALGAAALVLVVLLRYSLLVLLVGLPGWGGIIAAPVVGRTAMVVLVVTTPSRWDGSLAEAFAGGERRPAGIAAVLAILAVWPLAGTLGLIALALGAATAVVYGRWWQRRFGGLTGDGAGAAGLGTETLALCVFAGAVA